MRFDVVIVGAGMVGATFACTLGDSRLKVAILDTRSPAAPPANATDYDPRVSAITLASRTLFQNLGAWDAMQRWRVSPVEAMQVWEGQYGVEPSPSFPLPQAGEGGEPCALARGFIHFDAADIGEPSLAYIIENSVIQQALIERLHAFTNIHTLWPVEVDSITFDSAAASVTLKDGRRLDARLLVGADGAASAVRRAAGIDARELDMKQKGIVATVRTQRPHGCTARQHFLPTGPLAFLPLPEPNACSIVWSADNARADQLIALTDSAFATELESAFGDRLGPVSSLSPRQAFPLALAHARHYTAPRLALIGDAAHTVHPLAGQGVNLGLLDAAALAENVLAATARGRDLGDHAWLRRYERARKSENLGMIATTGGLRYLFGNDWPAVRSIRGFGLGLTNRLAPVKRLIMRRAAGLDSDLPALARART